jgi:hypothetical protein
MQDSQLAAHAGPSLNREIDEERDRLRGGRAVVAKVNTNDSLDMSGPVRSHNVLRMLTYA